MITQQELKELLHYDPETGVFTWIKARRGAAIVGTVAGSIRRNGYIQISVLDKCYSGHRLAFLYMTGGYPIFDTDHIDHNRGNNAWANLRSISRQENCKNRSVDSRNKSGITGVYWNKAASRWRAQIGVDGKDIHLGSFISVIDAANARKLAETNYGFHANHGAKQLCLIQS